MTRLSRLLLAALLALPLLAPFTPAEAAQINMCRPAAAGATPGPGRWTAPASGTSYTLGGNGCVNISPADLGDAQAAGFLIRSQIFAAVANALTAAGSVVLPAGTYIDRVIVQETSGAAVTGGIKLGTAAAGTQITTGIAVGVGALTWVPDSSLSTRIFAATAPQTVFIDAVTAWAGARVNVTIMYGYW